MFFEEVWKNFLQKKKNTIYVKQSYIHFKGFLVKIWKLSKLIIKKYFNNLNVRFQTFKVHLFLFSQISFSIEFVQSTSYTFHIY